MLSVANNGLNPSYRLDSRSSGRIALPMMQRATKVFRVGMLVSLRAALRCPMFIICGYICGYEGSDA
jgi:hypothetical protein